MTIETHKLASVSVTWERCSDRLGKNTGVVLTTLSVCQCGATTGYTWRFDAVSEELMESLSSGLIAAVQAGGGRLVGVPHLRAYSSSLGTTFSESSTEK